DKSPSKTNIAIKPEKSPSKIVEKSPGKTTPSEAAIARTKPVFPAEKENKPTKPVIEGPKYEASPDEAVIAFVNAELKKSWDENGVKPSPVATDAEFCRRAFLRIIGRIPTVEELQKYAADKSASKADALINELLDSDKYRPEFARHWASVWASVLI